MNGALMLAADNGLTVQIRDAVIGVILSGPGQQGSPCQLLSQLTSRGEISKDQGLAT